MKRIVLHQELALGDSVLLSGLCRDIQLTHPGQFDLLVLANFRETFLNNPHVRLCKAPADRTGAQIVPISYRDGIRAVEKSGQKHHMFSWYHYEFTKHTGIKVVPLFPKGDIHLTEKELIPVVPGSYWVVIAGGKLDATTKWWWASRYQEVVNKLKAEGITVVQSGALHREHRQPRLTGVVDMVGKSASSREFFSLIANSAGVICPITAAMHIAACFDKPCVVLGGGRESPVWEHYSNSTPGAFGPKCAPVVTTHQFLHTIGQLECCATKGCWKHRTVALGNHDRFDGPKERCKLPVLAGALSAPRCMDMITVDQVVAAVLSYGKPAVTRPTTTARIVIPGLSEYSSIEKPATPKPATPKPAVPVPAVVATVAAPSILDHPVLGGRITICVLCYGDHADIAKRCLGSIMSTAPMSRIDLRVGANAVCPETMVYLRTLPVTKIYDHPENAKKYTVMREMFNDPAFPLTTKYLIWFDDDTRAEPGWFEKLCQTIIANHDQGARLYGWPMAHDLSMFRKGGHDPIRWFKAAAWWRGKNLRTKGRPVEAANGTVIEFVPGWFWAVATDTIKTAGIPDARLLHNGGDITIGEQVHQQGWKIKGFNMQKSCVWCPSRENGGRRGFSEDVPWSKPGHGI